MHHRRSRASTPSFPRPSWTRRLERCQCPRRCPASRRSPWHRCPERQHSQTRRCRPRLLLRCYCPIRQYRCRYQYLLRCLRHRRSRPTPNRLQRPRRRRHLHRQHLHRHPLGPRQAPARDPSPQSSLRRVASSCEPACGDGARARPPTRGRHRLRSRSTHGKRNRTRPIRSHLARLKMSHSVIDQPRLLVEQLVRGARRATGSATEEWRSPEGSSHSLSEMSHAERSRPTVRMT